MQKQKRVGLSLTLLLGTLSAFGPLSLDMYLPALPTIRQSLNTNTSLVQFSISTCLIGLAVGQLFIGPWSDKVGRKKPLIIGLSLFTLTSLALMFINNIFLFLLIRLVQGLAGSAGQVLSRAIAKDLFDGQRLTKFYASLMAVNGIFPVISPIIGAGIVAFAPWQMIFGCLVLVGLILLLGSIFLLPETGQHNSSESSKMNFKSFANRAFLRPTIVLAFGSAVLFAYISGSSFVYQQVFNLSTQVFSVLYAINGTGIAVMSALAGRLIGKYSVDQITKVSLLVPLAVGCLTLLNSLTIDNHVLTMIGIFIIIATFGTLSAITTAAAMQAPGINAGSASAMVGLCSNIMGSLSSPLVGLFGATSAVPMIVIIIVFQSLAVMTFFGLKQRN